LAAQKPKVFYRRGVTGNADWWVHCRECHRAACYPDLELAYSTAAEHVRTCECLSELRMELLRKSSDGFRILDSLLEKWIEELQTIPISPSR
jgi:hypothetical protein